MTATPYGEVGMRMESPRDFDGVPIGTQITDRYNRVFTKIEIDLWEMGGCHYHASRIAEPCRVSVLPDGFSPRTPPQETVEAYKHRFRVYALSAAENHGVNYEACVRALDEMGTVEAYIPGTVLHRQALSNAPDGTVVYSGNPERVSGYSVWRCRDRTWEQVLGGVGNMNAESRVYSVNGSTKQPDWMTRPGTVEDKEAIMDFQETAWRVGWNLKRSQSWCSTYEAVLRKMGLTSAVTRRRRIGDLKIGDKVSPEQAAQLPVGTMLRWDSEDTDEWSVFVRASNSANAARTIRVAGRSASERNYRSSMSILLFPGDDPPVWIIPSSPELYDALMPGAVLHTIPDVGAEYVICNDHRVASWAGCGRNFNQMPATGRWTYQDLGEHQDLYIYGFRGVEL